MFVRPCTGLRTLTFAHHIHIAMGVSSDKSVWRFLVTAIFSIFALKTKMWDYFIVYGKHIEVLLTVAKALWY